MCSGSSTAPTGTTSTTSRYASYPYYMGGSSKIGGVNRALAVDTAEPVNPYASNYGYSATAPTYSQAERQWYIDNGYGDPLTMTNGYYQGVTQDARSAYLGAVDYANKVAAASRQYSSGMGTLSNARTAGSDVTYTYAGDALGIPKS